ncbi:unnamed protein product [Meganyctiphanes norvegica]|uniref:Mpv17-like protein n=1 Tax=Meganyctiphanes norvegica TaxID=48144 RepID=A0AAV2SEP3_MEGNR
MSPWYRAVRSVLEKHPLVRGMITYSVVWPTSNLVQQSFDKTRKKYDYMEATRYAIVGTFGMAPMVFTWLKAAVWLVPGTTIKHAIFKAYLEQILFAPLGQSQFYLGITLLEGKAWKDCVQEWKDKIIPTWKVSVWFWPFIQIINFGYVPERNRVVVVSCASFVWTVFLSYMHHFKGQTLWEIMHHKHREWRRDHWEYEPLDDPALKGLEDETDETNIENDDKKA